jgi:hypothetical protein
VRRSLRLPTDDDPAPSTCTGSGSPAAKTLWISNHAWMHRLLAGAALGGFVAAMVVVALVSATSDGGGATATTTVTRTTVTTRPPPTTTAPPAAGPIALRGAGAFDPEGDGHENDGLAPLAVDGNPTTAWKTEHYLHAFHKSGVGLVLDAGARHTFTRVAVGTDAAGASGRIELGDDPSGPFRAVSPVRPLEGTTTFTLRPPAPGRYLVIWLTALPASGEAHVTEVGATGS